MSRPQAAQGHLHRLILAGLVLGLIGAAVEHLPAPLTAVPLAVAAPAATATPSPGAPAAPGPATTFAPGQLLLGFLLVVAGVAGAAFAVKGLRILSTRRPPRGP